MEFESEHALNLYKRIIETQSSCEQITLISSENEKRYFHIPILIFNFNLKSFSYFQNRYPISRAILCAASGYFATMLASNFTESKCTEFVVNGVGGDTVQAMVDFCYTGRIVITQGNVDELIESAAFYQIDLLQQKCNQFLSGALNVSNAVQTLLTADEFSLSHLRAQAFELVCESLVSIPSADIQQINDQIIHELLICDMLQASEDHIFKRLMDWYEYERVKREKYMTTLLTCIRLNHISGQFLIGDVDATYRKFNCSELVTREVCRRTLNHSMRIYDHRSPQLYSVFRENGSPKIGVAKFNFALKIFEFFFEATAESSSLLISCDDKLIIFQGETSINGMFSSRCMYSIDLFSGQRENLRQMETDRSCFSAIVCEQYIYVIGGFFRSRSLALCERYK